MTMQTAKVLVTHLKKILAGAKERRPLTVLLVDDEEQVRLYLDRVLREAGYRTSIAKDGFEATRVAYAEGPFDVLLTDLLMPQMNGDELARRLRIMQPDLPVLYLTGFSDRLFIERQVLWQGEAFLDKPCTPRGLLEAMSLVRSTFSTAGGAAPCVCRLE